MADELGLESTSEFNPIYTGNLDAQSNIVSDIAGFAGATVADFGATVFNSLVPEQYEVRTSDMVRAFGDNALKAYNEHPDAVSTASFVGGLLVPSGLALKGAGALRAGAKGSSWFSTERRAADLTKLDELFKAGPAATAEYKALRNGLYARGLGTQLMDAAAMEMAVVGTMNAHPFMEDYLEDPIKNFGISMALGGVIGGGIGHIADRFAVKAIEGAAESKAFGSILGQMAPTPQGVPLAGQMHIRQQNIASLEKMLADGVENELTKGYANKILLEEKALQQLAHNDLISGMGHESQAYKDAVKQRILDDTRFAIAEDVRALRISEKLLPNAKREVTIADDFGPLSKAVNKLVDGVVTKVGEKSVTKVFYPELNGFGEVADAAYIGRAASLKGVTEESLMAAKSIAPKAHLHPRTDASFELAAQSAPVVDKSYLETLAFLNAKPSEKLLKTEIAHDDLPMLNAMAARMRKEGDPIESVSVKFPDAVRKLDSNALLTHLAAQKEQTIKTLLAEGRSDLEIAIRSNTPLDTVKAWMVSDKATVSLMTVGASTRKGFVQYANASDFTSYFAKDLAPLAVRTEVKKLNWAQQSANIDVQSANTMNNQIMESFYRQGQTQLVKDFTSFMYAPDMQKAIDIMRSQVANAVNGKSGVRFIQSADQFARKMGDFGVMASFIGKEIQGIANRTMDRMLSPIGSTLKSISTDPVKLVEINTAFKLNAELAEFRIYKDRQFWQKKSVLNDAGEEVIELQPVSFQGRTFKVVSDDVDSVLTHFQSLGREFYDTKNVSNKILGKPNMKDIGFWVPAFNPRNKHLAYVWDKRDDTTRILWGNSAEELSKSIAAFEPSVAKEVAEGHIQIVRKGDQQAENLLKGRDDAYTMQMADTNQFHSGASSPAIVRANADILGEIVGGLEHSVQAQVRHMAEVSLYDVSAQLERISGYNQLLTKDQPLGDILKSMHKAKDAAKEMRNMLFGLQDMPDYTNWKWANQSFEATLGYSMTKVGEIYKELSKPVRGFLRRPNPEGLSGIDYAEMSKRLKAAGVPNPYEVFGAQAAAIWDVAKNVETKNLASRLINTSNAVAATSALRFGEVAQPLVNAMSLPILMAGEIASKQAPTFLGAQLRAGEKINLAGAMHDGIRAMNSDVYAHWGDAWGKAGYFDAIVSEASKVMKMPRALEPGLTSKIEKALDSQLVTMLSKGADYSETLVRKTAMYTGGMIAKKLYPDLGDQGITIFARQFMDKVIGNYHAAQRPVFFQGTLGTAMGLFQTYMLTFAQSMYRQLEMKNYKALGKMMLAQSTVFGAGSLPGFHQVSELIGQHYSDEHTDLQTGVMRAVPDLGAKAILYGLPSSLGPAFYTRGEMNPRINTPVNLGGIATVDMVGQVVGTVGNVIKATSVDGEDVPRAIGQALSLQSVSRPLARVAELGTGYSITSKGTTMASPEEVWTTTGVMSRLLSMRPTEEAMLREANHLSTLYGSLDRDARQAVTYKLRTAIRNGRTADLEGYALDYFDKGGTPAGWRSAVNTAIAQTNVSFVGPLRDKLKPESSLNHMIDMFDE